MENLHQSEFQNLLSDKEVLAIVQSASSAKSVSIISWTLKEKDGELTGFLGAYWKLHIQAIVVRVIINYKIFTSLTSIWSN